MSKENLEKENNKKNLIEKNLRWILFGIFITVFFIILRKLLINEINTFDDSVYKYVSKIICNPITIIAKIITFIGSAYAIIPICLISIILFWKRKESIYIPVNLVIVFIYNQVLKRIIQRPRPEEFRIVEEAGFSFPSGHSMVSMGFYGFFIYLIYKNIKNKYLKWISIFALTIMILLIGLSRIYLGVHYASDVIAGFSLSICYLAIFTKLIFKQNEEK